MFLVDRNDFGKRRQLVRLCLQQVPFDTEMAKHCRYSTKRKCVPSARGVSNIAQKATISITIETGVLAIVYPGFLSQPQIESKSDS